MGRNQEMRKKQRNKKFIKRFRSELITFNVGVLAVSTFLTLPSSVLLAATIEEGPAIQIQEEGIWRERGLDLEYGLDEDFLRENNIELDEKEAADPEAGDVSALNLEADEKVDTDLEEDDVSELNLEADEKEEDDLEEEDLEEDDEDDLEENEQINVVYVNTFIELGDAIFDATSEVPTVINITDSFEFNSNITIGANRNITIQSEIETDVHTLLVSQSMTNRHFIISSGSSLTLGRGIILDGRDPEVTSGGVQINNNGNFIMNEGIITNCRQNTGGGVHILNNGNFIMKKGTIQGNKATVGGGVSIDNGGNFTMDDGTIYNNEAIQNGGGIRVEGTFIMDDGLIEKNISLQDGGGVNVLNRGVFTMGGGTIHNNEAMQSGGGVNIIRGGAFTMQKGTIHVNEALRGSGVSADGTFTMVDGIIKGNTAIENGGGVLINSSGRFIMETGSIEHNKAQSAGGVLVDGEFTMNGGTITENDAIEADGGGIYIWTSGFFIMEGGIIENNNANSYGGGVSVHDGGEIVMIDGFIHDNAASADGGGVNLFIGGRFTMEGGFIHNNEASHGGGVRSQGTLTMNGGEIYENDADDGGGIHSEGTLTMNDGVIHNNTAFIRGGGVNINQTTFTMNGGAIHTNIGKYGAGVYSENGDFTMEGGEIHKNTAENGGGGVWTNGSFNMGAGQIHGNFAENGAGVLTIDTFTMRNGAIIHTNTASENGGGVLTQGTLIIENGAIIHENKADNGNGGGVFATMIDTRNLIIGKDVVFSENSASTSQHPPFGVEHALPRIETRNSTLYNHPLNNYDIGYWATNPPISALSFSRNPESGGDVIVEGETNLKHLDFMGSELPVELVAEPAPGYRFVEWTSSNGGSFANKNDMSTVFTTPNDNTEITANFQRIMILDPLKPDEGVNPANPPVIPDTDGHITIDFVSSFDFGEQTISVQRKEYFAKPQLLLDENEQIMPNEERPNYIQISDYRVDNSGWTLSVTKMEPFKNEVDHELRGANLTFQHAEIVPASGTSLPQPDAKSEVNLTPNVPETLITAKEGEGGGTWIYRFGNETKFNEGVKLEVPRGANPSKASYQTTLNWELKSVPSN